MKLLLFFLFFALMLLVRGAETDPVDQAALLALWNGFINKGNVTWITNTGLCGQQGVACLGGIKVTGLNLQYRGLQGTISPELGNLTAISELSFINNGLTGTIPREISRLTQLRSLVLSFNNLTGTVPAEIYTSLPLLASFLSKENPTLCHYHHFLTAVAVDTTSPECTGCENPCLHNVKCFRGHPSFTCDCPVDFIGQICQVDLNLCRSNPCMNGGSCLKGVNSFSCDCTGTQHSGTICNLYDPTGVDCPLGSGRANSDADCKECPSGTFGTGTGNCIPCQKGTASNRVAATSAIACIRCPQGTYSDQIGASTCTPCSSCSNVAGSFSSTASPSEVLPSDFSLIAYYATGTEVRRFDEESVIGYYYLGIYLGLVLISGVLAVSFRKKVRKIVSPIATILKTPMSYMQVLIPSGIVTEIPSFFRGLVGIWVILGLIFVTGYQIHIFITQRVVQVSALQPGTVFKDGSATSKTSSTFRLSVVIHHSPIICHSWEFEIFVRVTDILPSGNREFPVGCEFDSSTLSVILTSISPEQLSFTPTSTLVLQVTSKGGTYLFNHGVSYELVMDSFSDRFVVMKETLVPSSDQIGGNADIDLSLIPSEVVTDTGTVSHGYSYSHFSSALMMGYFPSSEIMKITFEIPVSKSNYYQVKKTEAISGLQFVVGLLALASGVITGGSLGANLMSHLYRKCQGGKEGDLDDLDGDQVTESEGKQQESKASVWSPPSSSKFEVPLLESIEI